MYEHDTIAAIATPPGHGGIAIIRISGGRAEAIAQSVFLPAQPWGQLHTHHLYLGQVREPLTSRRLDQAMLALMRAPHSYTGEDTAEIHCHGGSVLSHRILEVVLAQGARLALPGEFTKRAFLNGRLDLSQAEAVLDLIQAKSSRGLSLAWEQLSGRLSDQCATFRDQLLGLTAHVEAFIDFPEEDVPDRTYHEFSQDLSQLISAIARLYASFAEGKIYRDGIRTVIVGKPNVGKSSVLNALAGTERAIVTAIPGTTRDVLEETIMIGEIPLVVWDTAGIRCTTDEVERIGVERARAGIQHAELVLAVFDASQPFDAEDEAVCRDIQGKQILPLINKTDLPPAFEAEEVQKRIHGSTPVFVSARNKTGFDLMGRQIHSLIFGAGSDIVSEPTSAESDVGHNEQGILVTKVRHRDALIKAEQYLANARDGLNNGLPLDLVAVDLRAGLDQIGEITGHISSEDILDQIFREFCIGK